MTAERWQTVRALFEKCLECVPQHRNMLLENESNEPEVVNEVLTLLRHHDEMEQDLLEAPHSIFTDAATGQVLQTGELIAGRFEIRRFIGQGGMGEVYQAYDKQLGELIAVKILRSALQDDPAATGRLIRELQLARRISHGNVCRVFDLLKHDYGSGELLVLTMEFIEGETLEQKLTRDGPLALLEAQRIARQMLAGLNAAHQAGVIHRDLKPSNIMLAGDRVVITDFGIARRALPLGSAAQTFTESRFLIGSLDYMAPEQIRGEPTTQQSDLYAAGLIFFELVASHKPIEGGDPLRRALKRLTGPQFEVPKRAAKWRGLIDSCLKLRPEDRPRSAADVLELLPDTDGRLQPRPFRLAALAVSGVAIMLLTLVAVGGFLLRKPNGAESPSFARVVALTALLGPAAFPAVSPDGQRIAFTWGTSDTSPGNLHILGADGLGLKRLSFDARGETHPAWSPDGKWIAFLRNSAPSADLVVIPASGGPERRLMFLPFSAGTLAWSHDGRFIGYTHTTFEQSPGQIHLLDVQNGQDFAITSPASGWGDMGAVFSPDDRWLAFIRFPSTDPNDTDVYLSELDTLRRPKRASMQVTFDRALVEGLAWTADGKSLIISSKRLSGSFGLWRLRSVTSGTHDALIEPVIVGGGDATSPSVSLSGKRLVYELDKSLGSHIELLQLKNPLLPAVPVCASSKGDLSPQFSRDGRTVYFASARSGTREIWGCDIATGHADRLTQLGTIVGSPNVSPDGSEILFDAASHGHWAIYAVRPTQQPRAVIDGPGNSVRPSWSSNGKWIYFSSDRNGDWQIWKVPLSGGATTQITHQGGFESFESNDGGELFFTKRNQPGLWAMPLSGDQNSQRRVMVSGENGDWARGPDGVYLLRERDDRPGTLQLAIIRSPDGAVRKVADFPGQLESLHDPSFAVSRDGRLLAYSIPAKLHSDIMMLTDFR